MSFNLMTTLLAVSSAYDTVQILKLAHSTQLCSPSASIDRQDFLEFCQRIPSKHVDGDVGAMTRLCLLALTGQQSAMYRGTEW